MLEGADEELNAGLLAAALSELSGIDPNTANEPGPELSTLDVEELLPLTTRRVSISFLLSHFSLLDIIFYSLLSNISFIDLYKS